MNARYDVTYFWLHSCFGLVVDFLGWCNLKWGIC